MSSNLKSIAAFVVAVLGIVFLILQRSIVSDNPVSIVIQILSVALMFWARWTFGIRSLHAGATPTQGGLVMDGPYRYLRHPIYASITYFVWAGVLPQMTILTLLGAIVVTASLYVRMKIEEHLLLKEYPGYAEYMKKAKRFLPFVI